MERPQAVTRPVGGAPAHPPLVAQALVVAFVQLMGTPFAARGQDGRQALDALGYALLTAGPLALVARRRRPVAVLLAVAASIQVYLLLGYPYGPVFLSLVIALYTAVTAGHPRAGWVTGAAVYVGSIAADWVYPGKPRLTLAHLVGWGAWLLVVLVVAEVARAQRERA